MVQFNNIFFYFRSKINWCVATDYCGNPETVCRDMNRDISATFDLKSKFPGRVYMIR